MALPYRTGSLFLLAVTLASLLFGVQTATAQSHEVYVADQVGNRVVVINGATGARIREFPLDPLGVTLVTGLGATLRGIVQEVVVLDAGVLPAPPTVVRMSPLGAPLGAFPAPAVEAVGVGYAFLGASAELYVLANTAPPTLFVMDEVAGAVLGACLLPLPSDLKDLAAATDAGGGTTTVWVLRSGDYGTEIYEVDAVGCLPPVLVGTYPWTGWGIGAGADNFLPVGPADHTLCVSDLESNCLHVIDAGTGAVLGTVPLEATGVIGPYVRGVGVNDEFTPAALGAGIDCIPALLPWEDRQERLVNSDPMAALFAPQRDRDILRGGPVVDWIDVQIPGLSPCDPEDVADSFSPQTIDELFCFDGPDITWPVMPPEVWAVAGGNPNGGAPAAGSFWHLEFDPPYLNKGATCEASTDDMFAAKPLGGPIVGGGVSYFVTSPEIPTVGWTGGVIEYSTYACFPPARTDYFNFILRTLDPGAGWSAWRDTDGVVLSGGCDTWKMNERENITPFLADGDVTAIQFGFHVLDLSSPGDLSWNVHGSVQMLIDNVGVGSFDPDETQFRTATWSLFADTFSLGDPAHTSLLANEEQGLWPARGFASEESLTIDVEDPDGVAAGSVLLRWRHDSGGLSPWFSKAMVLSQRMAGSTTDEGTYRSRIGADDGAVEDIDGVAVNGLVWDPGTTVEYYIQVTDNAANVALFPASVSGPTPEYFEFTVLPTAATTPAGDKILLVVDAGHPALDYEGSSGFDPTGGAGFGGFSDPVFEDVGDLTEEALALLFGGADWDRYDVGGSNTVAEVEPRVLAAPGLDIGGLMTGGVPVYDAVIWLHGEVEQFCFATSTRTDLKLYLDAGGKLLSSGDNVAFHLGSGGGDADSMTAFLSEYLGTQLVTAADNRTVDRTLNAVGVAGTSMAGTVLGLYGECPELKTFDRLTLGVSVPGQFINTVVMTYGGGNAADNNRAAAIKCARIPPPLRAGGPTGVAVNCGFDVSALVSPQARACVIGRVLAADFGIAVPVAPECGRSGVDAPVLEMQPVSFSLEVIAPNPSRGIAQITFSVPRRGPSRLDVFDVLGRRVRRVSDEFREAGAHAVLWDGLADDGRPVANGIYFVRLEAGAQSATRKAVMLR